jgi:acyl carrier protein
LSITGREKDEIIVNGVNIPAAEIEAAAESVAGVRASCTAACALRRSDAETDGMALFFACTADESGRDSQAVAKRVREHLAASFGVMPDELVPLEAARIPRTSIGKIRRAELRQQLEAGEFDQQRIVSSRDSEPSVPQWCYRPQWQRREVAPIHNDASKAARTALMIADEAGVSQSLRDKLCGEGWNVCMVQPPSSRLAIHGALPDVMLYPLHSDALHASSELLHLIQVLEHTGNASGRNMRLIVWTSGESGASSAVAAAAALLRSAMRELPYFMASVVELADAPGASAAAELLHRELHHAAAADVRVRYMGAQRYVQRLAPIAMPLREQPSPLEIGGRYIITGGLGGIGIELASHLLTVWHAKLLIIGRREVDTSGAVTRLQSQGDVRYAAAPVEDLQKLDAAVQAAERYWGASVSGAFHLAGEFHEALIVAETAEGLTRSISPKVDGARSLRILLARRPGRALLVGFGSANGYFGGAGAGAYAAANAAMAALLAEPHERVQTRCLDWSMWAGIGMSRAYSDHRATVAAGFDLISVRQGIASFEAALRVEDRHLIIGIDGRAPAMRPHVLTPPANLEKLVICHHPDVRIDPVALPEMEDEFGNRLDPAIREVDLKPLGAHGHHDRDALRRRICGGDDDADAQPRSDVERLVANAFAEVLGIARVGRDEHFLEIGGNSLAATQVISRLRPQFGSAISVRDLFEHPTVASLAQSLQERPVAQAMLQQEPSQSVVAASEAEIDVNGLTDEQVTAMLDSLLAAGEESR